jgi:formylglycine-generating enzyme required for sulfatase activity
MRLRSIALCLAALAMTGGLVHCWYDLESLEANSVAPTSFEGGVDAGADVTPGDAAPPSFRCPEGRGPAMVNVGAFCVDSTEVTQRHYGFFLAASAAAMPQQPAVCAWNVDFTPRSDVAVGLDLPAVGLDWCDAFAYCAWAGKRLCGKIGGGSVPRFAALLDDPASDQWFAACSGAGKKPYPYGPAYDKAACVGEAALGLQAAGTRASCVGGFSGLFDMSGNAWEWEDSCDDAGNCVNRGGAFQSSETALACAYAGTSYARPRTDRIGDTAFRCCSP